MLEDNIEVNLKGIGWQDVEWIDLAQDWDMWELL
jgi:hypothetical protein